VTTLALLCATGAAFGLAPRSLLEIAPERLDVLIPSRIGTWQAITSGPQQVSLFAVDEDGGNPMERVYDDSLLRSYVHEDGRQMMVAIAYDRVQREEDRVHRPEICYVAQGFTILSDEAVTLSLNEGVSRAIEGRQMIAKNGGRLEAISYWIRIGDTFTQNPWRSRIYIIQEGLAGRLHDGILVRVSEIIPNIGDAPDSFARQERFLDELVARVSPSAAELLASSARSSAAVPGSTDTSRAK
jgi:EpsI family protein